MSKYNMIKNDINFLKPNDLLWGEYVSKAIKLLGSAKNEFGCVLPSMRGAA